MSNNMTTHHAATGFFFLLAKNKDNAGEKEILKRKNAGEKDKYVDEVCALIQKHLTEVYMWRSFSSRLWFFLMERPWSKTY
jgi:hypothetical protein